MSQEQEKPYVPGEQGSQHSYNPVDKLVQLRKADAAKDDLLECVENLVNQGELARNYKQQGGQ